MCSGQCEASEADEPVTLAVAVPLALASAGLFAVGTAVQHRAAVAHPGTDQGHVRLILSLARRPAWLLSNLALIAGVVLHGVALSKGTLVVVQPLLVSGLLFTMPLSARLHRRRVTLAQWLVASSPSSASPCFCCCRAAAAGTYGLTWTPTGPGSSSRR